MTEILRPGTTSEPVHGDRSGRESRVAKDVAVALARYLDTVTVSLRRRGMAVCGVETNRLDGVFTGAVQLVRQRDPAGPRQSIELGWNEVTGWHAAGTGPGGSRPHYLQATVVPEPDLVADFADNLLRGGQPGQVCPAQSWPVEHGPWALLAALTDGCQADAGL